MRDQSPWPEGDAKLRELWARGLPTLTIADMMRLTKNQVIGRVHRLPLPARPSPIKGPMKPRAPRVKVSAPPPAPRVVPPIVESPSRPVAVRPLAVLAPWLGKPVAPAKSCCWPFGEPRTPGFRFCEAATLAGFSYCAAHKRKAYQPRRTMAERTAGQIAAEKAYVARMATIAGRGPLGQWRAAEI